MAHVLSAPNCFWSGSWDTWLTGDSAITAVRQALLQWCCHDFTHGFKVIFINPTHKVFILKTIKHLKSLQPPTFQETPGYSASRLLSPAQHTQSQHALQPSGSCLGRVFLDTAISFWKSSWGFLFPVWYFCSQIASDHNFMTSSLESEKNKNPNKIKSQLATFPM